MSWLKSMKSDCYSLNTVVAHCARLVSACWVGAHRWGGCLIRSHRRWWGCLVCSHRRWWWWCWTLWSKSHRWWWRNLWLHSLWWHSTHLILLAHHWLHTHWLYTHWLLHAHWLHSHWTLWRSHRLRYSHWLRRPRWCLFSLSLIIGLLLGINVLQFDLIIVVIYLIIIHFESIRLLNIEGWITWGLYSHTLSLDLFNFDFIILFFFDISLSSFIRFCRLSWALTASSIFAGLASPAAATTVDNRSYPDKSWNGIIAFTWCLTIQIFRQTTLAIAIIVCNSVIVVSATPSSRVVWGCPTSTSAPAWSSTSASTSPSTTAATTSPQFSYRSGNNSTVIKLSQFGWEF